MIEFKQLRDFPGYKVYSDGRVWSYRYGKFLKQHLCGNRGRDLELHGYLFVTLQCERVKRHIPIHVLMLEEFIGSRPDGMEGCHRNDNKKDNDLGNLYWGTPSQNMVDRSRNGKNPTQKLSGGKVKVIKRSILKDASLSNRLNLAKLYGVSISTINHIWKKRIYRWVK